MSETDRILAEAAKTSPEDYYQAMILQTRAIHARMNDPSALTARLVGNDNARLKELLAVSVILNDCTSVVYNSSSRLKVNLPQHSQFQQAFGTEEIRFSLTEEQIINEGIDRNNPDLGICFLYSDNPLQKALMNSLAPFIEDGSVVFEPSRGIIAKRANSWHVMGVDSRGPLDQWSFSPEGITGRPIPLEIDSNYTNANVLFDVTLPFMRGVPMKELHRMLRNENDLVLAFRAAIRNAVREATNNKMATNEIVADTIQPRLNDLDRKLRRLQKVQGLKVGGAAFGSLAIALTQTSAPSIAGAVLGFASAGGFGFAYKEYSDYVEKRDSLHQDPYYFLWKVRQAKQGQKNK